MRTPPPKRLEKSISPWTNVKNGRIFSGDAVELLKQLPNESIDLVITDLPYESLERWRNLGTTTRLKHSKSSSNDWFDIFPNSRLTELFAELFRVMKRGTHLYLFCNEETRDVMTCGWSPQSPSVNLGHSPLLQAGFKYWKSLVWNKEIAGMGYHFRAQYELIIMAEKVLKVGKHRRLNSAEYGDVLTFRRLKGKDFYPTEKPHTLVELLVNQSSEEGDTVLDPFMGGGTVPYACVRTGRKFVAGDIGKTSIEHTMLRLKSSKRQSLLGWWVRND